MLRRVVHARSRGRHFGRHVAAPAARDVVVPPADDADPGRGQHPHERAVFSLKQKLSVSKVLMRFMASPASVQKHHIRFRVSVFS